MSLFHKNIKVSKDTVPGKLNIKQERADQIIDAIKEGYFKAKGDVTKVMADIKDEKTLKGEEKAFAYYSLGAIKIITESKMVAFDEMMGDPLRALEQMFKEMRGEN